MKCLEHSFSLENKDMITTRSEISFNSKIQVRYLTIWKDINVESTLRDASLLKLTLQVHLL